MRRALFLILLLPLLGGVISCLFTLAKIRGTFTEWEMLGKPTGTNLKEFIRLDYVQSETGEIFEFQYPPACTGNCWLKVESLPPASEQTDLLPLENCERSFDIPLVKQFSDFVMECKRWGTGILLEIQAIDQDGNIQMWRDGQDDFGDPLMLTTSPFLGAIYGFVLAVVLTLLIACGLMMHDWSH